MDDVSASTSESAAMDRTVSSTQMNDFYQTLKHFEHADVSKRRTDPLEANVEHAAGLDEYLRYVARTGIPMFDWHLIRSPLVLKFDLVSQEIAEQYPFDHLPPMPNVPRIVAEEYIEDCRKELMQFNGIPFTIQRICELLMWPNKHYRRADKLMRALRKNLLVVSCVKEDGQRSITPEMETEGSLDDAVISGSTELRCASADPDLSVDNEASGVECRKRALTEPNIQACMPIKRAHHDHPEEKPIPDDLTTPVPLPSLSDTFPALSSGATHQLQSVVTSAAVIMPTDLLQPAAKTNNDDNEIPGVFYSSDIVQENVVSDSLSVTSSSSAVGASKSGSEGAGMSQQCEPDSTANSDDEKDTLPDIKEQAINQLAGSVVRALQTAGKLTAPTEVVPQDEDCPHVSAADMVTSPDFPVSSIIDKRTDVV